MDDIATIMDEVALTLDVSDQIQHEHEREQLQLE
jgi:hypothetical protein